MKYKNSLSSAERLDGILHLIENSRHITVEMICSEFHVSAATARRDLEFLRKQSSIQRVHGGAVALHKSPPENPVFQRMNIQTDNKRLIGIAAAGLIDPGDTLFLGSGTTVLEVAKNIKQIDDLTVITNSLLVLNELIEFRNITLVDPGGLVRRSEHSLIGDLTESTLSGLNADKVIIGIHGIDLEQGLTNRYLPETMTDRKILQMGKKIIIVADHTKCGLISTSHVASISVINTLVTDMDAPADFVENLKERGINVVQAGLH
jgi:DeoR/GlpR family transcriptional regulator of sugar metabolism